MSKVGGSEGAYGVLLLDDIIVQVRILNVRNILIIALLLRGGLLVRDLHIAHNFRNILLVPSCSTNGEQVKSERVSWRQKWRNPVPPVSL